MDQKLTDYSDIQGLLDGIRPIPRLTVSEWADKYRYLSSVSSAIQGRYKTDYTPYMRKIMDCLSYNETYKKVVFMKSAQCGGTEAAVNFVGYAIHINPAPIMLVEPKEDMMKKVSKFRIDPTIEMCPELKKRVAEKKSRDSSNTVNQKSFPGGVLFLTGANSATSLRSVPVRFLILDEVDGYPPDLDGEGSPIDLAIARTQMFPNKKIFIVSTPTKTSNSAIEREFLATDQNYFYVPCPHCGEMQRLVWQQLIWDEGKPETALYFCIHCGVGIEERYKEEFLVKGEWRPEHPELSDPDTIGFHINALYAPFGMYSWKEMAIEFIKAQGNQEKLKTFVNTKLGETWEERGEAPPYKNLYNRRENYPMNVVPDDVCFLTCGVDTQDDRLELEIVGWCADKRSYSIDYRVLEGNTAKPDVWNQLAEIVDERFYRSDGVEYAIQKMAIDSGGHNTTHVYSFCRRYYASRVIPIKGMDHMKVAIAQPKKTRSNKVGSIGVWGVGVSFLKLELYAHLRLEKDSDDIPPPWYCHFPEYPEHYFRGLTAEELVTKKTKQGYEKQEWVKIYSRNEQLDCRVYARAAASAVGLDKKTPEQLRAMVARPIPKQKSKPNEENLSPNVEEKKRRKPSIWDN